MCYIVTLSSFFQTIHSGYRVIVTHGLATRSLVTFMLSGYLKSVG